MSPRGLDLDFEDQLAKGASPLIHLVEFLGQGLPTPPLDGDQIANLRLERVTKGLLHFKDLRGLPNLDDFNDNKGGAAIGGGWAVPEADGIGLYFERPSDGQDLALCCETTLALIYNGYQPTDEFTYYEMHFDKGRGDPSGLGGWQTAFVVSANGDSYGATRFVNCLGTICGSSWNEDAFSFPNGGNDFSGHVDTGIKVQLKGGSDSQGPITQDIVGGPIAWVYPIVGAMAMKAPEIGGAGSKVGFSSHYGIFGACIPEHLCNGCCHTQPQRAKWLAYMRNRSVTILDVPPQYTNGLMTIVGPSKASEGTGQLDLGRVFAGSVQWSFGEKKALSPVAGIIVNGVDFPFHTIKLDWGIDGFPDLKIDYNELGVSEEEWVWGGDVYRVVGWDAAAGSLPSFDICTADVPVEALGKTWAGLGRENIVFDGIRETGDLRAQGVNIQLPATDLASVVAQLRQTHHRGGTVNIYAAHWDEASGKVIGEPKLISSGFSQGGFEVKEVVPEDPDQPAYAVITARIASRVAELDKRTGIVTNKASHNLYYPDDDFFLGIEEWIGREIPWGQDE